MEKVWTFSFCLFQVLQIFICSSIALPHIWQEKTVENFYKFLTTNLTGESWKKSWKFQLFHVKFVVKHLQKFSTVVLFSCQICGKVIGESLNFFILSFPTASVFHMFSNCFTTYLTGKNSWKFLQMLYHKFDMKKLKLSTFFQLSHVKFVVKHL